MFAFTLKNKLDKLGIHYSWLMVLMAFITTMFSSAVISTPQILILPITKAYGWNISDITSSIGVMFFVLASIAPFGGALILRFGIPKIVIISCSFATLGLASTVLVSEKWHLYISIGICLGIASGILGLGLSAAIATRWFNKRRGLVTGILTSAFAAGQLIFVPLMAWFTTIFNWQYVVIPVLIGSITCSILFLFFGKSWPSELKIPPYGDNKIYNPPLPSKENAIYISFNNLYNAIYNPAFLILAATFFICGLTSNGLILQHFIPFCADNNIGIVVASSYLAIMGIFNFIGTNASGWLSDRYNNYYLLAIYYTFRGISLLYLPYSNLDFYALTLWAIFFGLDFIATVPPTVRLTSKFFGSVNGPVIFGWIFAAHQYGAAFSASTAGIAREEILSYDPIFIFAGITCFFATILIFIFKVMSNKIILN